MLGVAEPLVDPVRVETPTRPPPLPPGVLAPPREAESARAALADAVRASEGGMLRAKAGALGEVGSEAMSEARERLAWADDVGHLRRRGEGPDSEA